ncbi:MAG: type VII toxin-antitoxin system HepT family RNase toxin [Egibacteraceae bacterium]
MREIDRRVAALREAAAGDEAAFLHDADVQARTERHLQVALQSAIDIALHVLAEDSAATPEDYGSAFLLLAGLDVIPQPLAQRLRGAAGLRNVLVHTYLELDPKQVWRHLDDLDDLVEFARAVESYLDPGPG